LECFEGTEAA